MTLRRENYKGSVLVTGGAKRIGRSIALALAEYGYNIGLHYNTSAEEAHKTAEEVRKIGVNCTLFKADLSNFKEIKALAKEAPEMLPDYNLLVNSAAIFERTSFLETGLDDYMRHFNINLRAPFFLTQKFALTAKKGNVINITDAFITKNKSPYFSYMLAKKALYEFTKMAAEELGPKIRVNGLALGVVLPANKKDEELKQRREKSIPFGKASGLKEINDTIKNILESDVTGECFFLE